MSLLQMRGLLDLDELQKVLGDFSEATGLATVAVDTQGVPVTPMCAFTDFCRAMRADPERGKLCKRCDAHGGLQSLLEGRAQIYRCHAGLVDFSVPFSDDEAYVGAILCGQVRLPEPEMPGYLMAGSDWRGDPELEELYEQVPTTSRRKVDAAAETLMGLHTLVEGNVARVHGTFGENRGRPADTQHEGHARPPLTVVAMPTPPRPARARGSTGDTTALREAMAGQDIGTAFAEVSRLLDAAHSSADAVEVRGGLDRVDEVILDMARQMAPRLVPHLGQLVLRERRRTEQNRYESQLHAEKLLGGILDEAQRGRPRRMGMRELLNDIARNPGRALSLTDAANFLHWSPGHLSKLFKSTTGCTFVSYVTARRISRARLMLASTQMSVQKIATELDFSQVNYFSRVFRASTGMSPSEYRRQCSSCDGRSTDVTVQAPHHPLLRA